MKQYSEADVEKLLRETAQRDRRPMDDATTERFLSLIRGEMESYARRWSFKRVMRWAAAAVVVLGVGVPLAWHSLMDGGGYVAATPACSLQNVHDPDPECASECTPVMGAGSLEADDGDLEDRRVFLNHFDNTLNAGYTPLPQETYEGRSGRCYGASVQGEYEITACTDIL